MAGPADGGAGAGKSDPASAEIELRPGAELRQDFGRLEFVNGTAYMGYDLKAGRTYRVVALYRPGGISGPGFCSAEQTVAVK